MGIEFDKYVADKENLNLISKEDVATIKIKMGKSHRKEKDWEVIKSILISHDILTFRPGKRSDFLTEVEGIACEDGYLVVFTNGDDLERHIQDLHDSGYLKDMVNVISIAFEDVIDIADKTHTDIIIDEAGRSDQYFMLYTSENKKICAVMLG